MSGVEEIMEQKLKARDIIPGWPKGRSTSRTCAAGSVWPWVAVYEMIGGNLIGVFPRMELEGLGRRPWPADSKTLHLDHAARLEDRVGQQAEERHKAEMMEGFWEQKRIEARGNLYPEPMGEKMVRCNYFNPAEFDL